VSRKNNSNLSEGICRVVVTISEENACWNIFESGKIPNQVMQRIGSEVDSHSFQCTANKLKEMLPGSAGKYSLAIIVNSELDDVDRVKLKESAENRFSWLSKNRLMRQLRSEYPEASVWRLPARYSPEVASLLHSVISPKIRLWLKHIQEQGYIISHVATVPQLLIASYSKESCARLFCLDVNPNVQRHFLLDAGVPVFMRCVQNGQNAVEVLLEETREHIAAFLDVDKTSPRVISINEKEESEWNTQSEFLSSLFLSLSNAAELFQHSSEEIELSDGPSNYFASDQPEGRVSGAIQAEDNLLNSESTSRKISIFKACRLQSSSTQFSVVRNPIGKLVELQPSVLVQRQINISEISNTLVRLLGLISVISVLIVIGYGYIFVRENSQLDDEQSLLDERLNTLEAEVAHLHPYPDQALMSLKRRQWFEAGIQTSPHHVMLGVAKTLKSFPRITLDTFRWVVSENQSAGSEVLLDVNQSSPRTMEVLSRDQQQKVMIGINGSVAFDFSDLRKAQEYLERYINDLREVAGVRDVVLIQSPVDSVQTKIKNNSERHVFELTMAFSS